MIRNLLTFIRLRSRALLLVYLIMLFLVSTIPFPRGSAAMNETYVVQVRSDYLLHALVYLPMPLLLGLFLERGPVRQDRRKFLFWLGIILPSLLFTVLFEGVQLILPYRSFNINDMMANGLGVVIGLLIMPFLWRRTSAR